MSENNEKMWLHSLVCISLWGIHILVCFNNHTARANVICTSDIPCNVAFWYPTRKNKNLTMKWMLCIISMGKVCSGSSCLSQSTKHNPLHFPTANMQIFCCASNSGAWFAQVIIQHTRTPASVLSISTAANVTLTNTDRLVCNFGNSSRWNWTMTSTDTELKISQGRLPWFIITLLSLLLNAAENSCSPSWKPVPCKSCLQCQEAFFLRRGQKIFWYRRFNSFTFPTYLSIL